MQNIDSDLIRGNIDTIILKTMIDGDMYGLDIIREVENKSNGTYELKQPTLYSCLKRLENQELISSYWLDSSIGGKRHYYKLTEKGLETIKHKQEEWSKSKFIIDNLLGDFDSEEYRLVKKDDYEKIIEGKPVIQYITIPSENTSQETNLIQNNEQQSKSDLEILNEYETTEESYDDFNFESVNEELPEAPKKIQTFSEYQSIIEDVINSKNETIIEDNDLICFNNESEISNFGQENVEQKNNQSLDNYKDDSKLNQENLIETNQNNSLDFIQQNLFDDLTYPYQNEVDNSILEFTKNISRLNNFDYSDETKRQEELEKQRQIEEEEQKKLEAEKLISQSNSNENNSNIIENEVDSSQFHTKNLDENFLSELSVLEEKNEPIFDEFEYQKESEIESSISEEINNEKIDSFDIKSEDTTKNIALEEKNTFIDFKIEPTNSIQTQYGDSNDSSSYAYDSSSNSTGFSFQNDEPEAFFELSYANFTPTKENEEYKKKLQNLNEYSKINTNNIVVAQNNIESKDLRQLKSEFEKEGIKLRQYSKANEKEAEKNHILINKLNLIKSLILLFAYVFILSASYIIMKNTDLKNILNFSLYSFVYAIIPFAIYTLYYLTLFIINPHKKTPAKYSPRIMMFFSIIITIQLLLIVYCSNLQFGFYSFTQAGYNHLLWIIPSIISIAPIIITIIHTCLFNSKNFNV